MNARPTSHPAASPGAWRPGFAKRADNFERVVHAARTWRYVPAPDGRPILARLATAILCGTPDLNQGERWMLCFLASHLNAAALKDHAPFVWVSVGLAAKADDCAERSIRRRLEGLERKGFIVRHFNHANRPDGREAYDLGALLSRLDELEAVYDAKRQTLREEKAAQRRNVLTPMSAYPDNGVRLEQVHSNLTDSAGRPVSSAARDRAEARLATLTDDRRIVLGGRQASELQRGSKSLPKRANFIHREASAPSNPVHRLQAELKAAIEACPALAGWVSPSVLDNPLDSSPEVRDRIIAAAQALLPQPERNNGLTAEWCLRRHGIRTVAMLAVALTDPAARQPPNHLFGWFATAPGSDRVNLIQKLTVGSKPSPGSPTEGPKPASADTPIDFTSILSGPGACDPEWLAIAAALRRRIRQGAYGSWFSQIGYHGSSDGVLSLSAPPTAAAKLRSEFGDVIREAATAAGFDVTRVAITARGGAHSQRLPEGR